MTCNCTTDANGNLLDIGCPEHGDWLSDEEMTELFKDAEPYENCRTPRSERETTDWTTEDTLWWTGAIIGYPALVALLVCLANRVVYGVWPWQ